MYIYMYMCIYIYIYIYIHIASSLVVYFDVEINIRKLFLQSMRPLQSVSLMLRGANAVPMLLLSPTVYTARA